MILFQPRLHTNAYQDFIQMLTLQSVIVDMTKIKDSKIDLKIQVKEVKLQMSLHQTHSRSSVRTTTLYQETPMHTSRGRVLSIHTS